MSVIENHTFETSEREISGVKWYVARCSKATPKGKYSKTKHVFAFRFRTEAERDTYLETFKAGLIKSANEDAARKVAKANAKKNLVNPFKVGDILYDSWGYDQTNIDFYQVVGVGAKSVKLARILSENVGECGFMCEYVMPMKDHFFTEDHPLYRYYGGVKTHILQIMMNGDGTKSEAYVSSTHGWISKWDGQKKYASHYA